MQRRSTIRTASAVPTTTSLARCGLVVFLANAAILVLQLIVGRLLSPYLGMSLETWTAVIGVFLTGICLGNWFGGQLADRSPRPAWLGLFVALGGLAALAMIGLPMIPGFGEQVRRLPLGARILALTFATGFPASFFLSAVTPLAIKLGLADVEHTGRVAGLIYALGTLGSLAGAFLTGLVLVAHFTVNTIGFGVAALLFLLALLPNRSAQASSVPDDPHLGVDEEQSGPVAARSSALTGKIVMAALTVGIASFCSMALELTASRLLAPVVGVSLFSWMGIIGVLLAAMACGNYLGGWLADRWPRSETLGLCLLLAGLSCLGILAAFDPQSKSEALPSFGLVGYIINLIRALLPSLGLVGTILSLVATLFFLPMILLGSVSPQVTRLTLSNLREAGRVAGRIYACSRAGAIAGTFATGWFLISWVGVNRVIFLAGAILVVLAFVAGRLHQHQVLAPFGFVATLLFLAVVYAQDRLRSPYTRETNYYAIQVWDELDDNGEPVKKLVLDHLIHSYLKPDDPTYLGYPHEQVQTELTRYAAARTEKLAVLVIGGGGYTYPRWVEAMLPQVDIDVVEIDPGVTEVAHRELGLARSTRIRSHHLDGRQFIVERAPKGHYDLVIQDAVNDLSVPFHLMTREYNEAIRRILKPDGVYLSSIIDSYQGGQFLFSAVRTMKETFGEVTLLADQPGWDSPKPRQMVYVIFGSQRPFDAGRLQAALQQQNAGPAVTVALDKARLEANLAASQAILLTDQFAPVDQLMAAVFRQRGM